MAKMKTDPKKAAPKKAAPKKAVDKRSATAPSARVSGRRASKAPEKRSAKAKKKTTGKAASQPFPIVGVGASAGGLEAFTALLKALPTDTGMAFVLVQHMDPTHESMLVPLLARATEMPVSQVKDRMAVGPDRVYVIPPNTTMSIHRGVLRLVSRHKAGDGHMPINDFLDSLAADRHSGAIGVILSGTASDGTLGLKAIKAEGGITFAQDEQTAKYPGMPQSAVNAGYVDFVMPPERIAAELTRIKQLPYFGKEQAGAAEEPAEFGAEEPRLERIFSLLHNSTGVDFRLYKRGTIQRRIQRRMALGKTERLEQYVNLLEKHPSEVEALFDDILIHVTGFFREPEAFQTLKTAVFPQIRARLTPDEAIRIWVAGCSSGEEVYSIAMTLLEFLGDGAPRPRIQIFGTDISERDIERARAGIYPESSVAKITPARLRRYFVKAGDSYQIVKGIREMCVFARHDLAADPPFSRLDLITCRNLLIYMSQPLQKRMISLFHYALNPDGYLLLGKSEAISGYSHLFAATDRKSNLYIRKAAPVSRTFEITSKAYEKSLTDRVEYPADAIPFNLRKEGERVMLERFAPPGFFVDTELNIAHFQGDTSPFLKPASGEASFQLLKMVRPELQMPLKTAVHKANKSGHTVRGEAVEFDQDGQSKVYEIEVIPLNGARSEKSDYLVLFHGPKPDGSAPPTPAKVSPATQKSRESREMDRLRREVSSAREYLRTVTEEQEAGAEELRAANEEILSSNEELQSTNEELETAKEELQSSNEELNTLNEELQNRNRELDQLANDLSNLLTGVEIPILILGEDLCIRRFTPPAGALLNLMPSDIGRPIHHIRPRIQLDNLDELAADVIAQGRVVEREVQDTDGRWHSLRMKPYTTAEKKIDGVLLAFVDVTRLKIAEVDALREREATITALLETAAQGILAIDKNGEMRLVNSAVEKQFGYRRQDLLGRSVEMLLPERYRRNHAKLRAQFFKQPSQRPMGTGLELHGRRKGGSEFPIEVSLSRIPSKDGPLAIAFVADVSERRRSESELRSSEARLQSILTHSPALIYLKDLQGRYLLANRACEKLLKRGRSEIEGKTPFALYTRAAARRYSEETKEVVRSGKPRKFEQTVQVGRRAHTLLCEEFPLKDSGRHIYAVCGICNDISERKRMEEAARENRESLRALTNRLIWTQEQQYGALARELHDDLSSKLAALGLEIDAMKAEAFPQDSGAPKSVESVQTHIADLGASVHALSRRLHPSVLDDLGLAPALENECRAFSQRYNLPAGFRSKGVPKRLPEQIALCMYRVAQESLLNVGKHSSSSHVAVELTATKKELVLRIRDIGDGFDLHTVKGKGGLGLVSMEERVRFVGGRLTIESQPGDGTRVEARIPLDRARPKRKPKAG